MGPEITGTRSALEIDGVGGEDFGLRVGQALRAAQQPGVLFAGRKLRDPLRGATRLASEIDYLFFQTHVPRPREGVTRRNPRAGRDRRDG